MRLAQGVQDVVAEEFALQAVEVNLVQIFADHIYDGVQNLHDEKEVDLLSAQDHSTVDGIHSDVHCLPVHVAERVNYYSNFREPCRDGVEVQSSENGPDEDHQRLSTSLSVQHQLGRPALLTRTVEYSA